MSDDVMKALDIDRDDPGLALKVAAERLSMVRYVFLVQIEDGIATAGQRASLEYADAVLIGWPEADAPDVTDQSDEQLHAIAEHMSLMEQYIDKFRTMEREGDIDGLTDTLIRITERVAEVRRSYQPGFPLPTFAEIRRVVQDEWDEEMNQIDPQGEDPTAEQIERESEEERRSQESGRAQDAGASGTPQAAGRDRDAKGAQDAGARGVRP